MEVDSDKKDLKIKIKSYLKKGQDKIQNLQ